MKKNWMIIGVAIFVCASVAAFLFTQGRVKVVEKVVTIYKETDSREVELPVNTGVDKKPVGLAKAETSKSQSYDFEDSDYHIADEEYYFADNEEVQHVAKVDDSKNKTTADSSTSAKPTETAQADEIPFLNVGGQNRFSTPLQEEEIEYANSSAAQEYTDLADEGIPIPQLPLCDADYEVADDGGYENDGLPQLPEIDRI